MEIIQCDVLVVGGGVAGMRAALEAQRRGASVAVAVKGDVGTSGSSTFRVTEAAGYGAADGRRDPTDNPSVHFEDIMNAARGVCDPKLATIHAHKAPDTIHDLMSWGVKFEKEDGSYLITQGCYGSKPRNYNLKGHGTQIVTALNRQLRNTSVRYYSQCMIVKLIVEEHRCCGAIGVYRDGTGVLFSAGSTVLATGGAGRIFKHSLNPQDITGDGYALGYRAGADLINMEFMQCGFGIVSPSLSILNSWIWSVYPRLHDNAKMSVLDRFLPPNITAQAVMDAKSSHYPFSSENLSKFMEISVQKTLIEGRGSKNNGVYLDIRDVHLSDSGETDSSTLFQDMWRITDQWLRSKGLDYRKQPLEIACFAHAINGGLRIDQNAETTIKGLYAAGEAAGGPHGADRLGGNMLPTCMVFGEIAGFNAEKNARGAAHRSPSTSIRSDAERYLQKRYKQNGSYRISSLKSQLQDCMWRNALVVRSEKSLRNCMESINAIHDTAEKCAAETQDAFSTFELENMLVVSEMMTKAALKRKESRGSHYREDFPEQGGQEWERPITINKNDES